MKTWTLELSGISQSMKRFLVSIQAKNIDELREHLVFNFESDTPHKWTILGERHGQGAPLSEDGTAEYEVHSQHARDTEDDRFPTSQRTQGRKEGRVMSIDKYAAESTAVDVRKVRIEQLERALKQIATIEHCNECDTYGDPDTPFTEDEILQHRLDHPVTHETVLWGHPLFLCTSCAERVALNRRKAESKGSGKQPEVVPYRGKPHFVHIARLALAQGITAPKEPAPTEEPTASAPAVRVVASGQIARFRSSLINAIGIIEGGMSSVDVERIKHVADAAAALDAALGTVIAAMLEAGSAHLKRIESIEQRLDAVFVGKNLVLSSSGLP